MANASTWNVTPTLSGSAGGGPVGGTVSQFIVDGPGKRVSAVFAGIGVSVGGPLSFTYSDADTRGFPGPLIWRYGLSDLPPDLQHRMLTCSTNGFMQVLGSCPRQLLNQYTGRGVDITQLSGMYFMIIGFCMSPSVGASVLLDMGLGGTGWTLPPDVTAYSLVASLAKGIDIGGAEVMAGSWFFA